MGYLKKFVQERVQQLQDAFITKDGEKSSYTDRVILKILDNLHLNFKNINIRIEEPNKNPCYSLGLTLEEMFVVNTNENWEEKFIDRSTNKFVDVHKLLKIKNFGIYLKTDEAYFISTKNLKIPEIKQEMDVFFPLNTAQAKDIDYLIKPSNILNKI